MSILGQPAPDLEMAATGDQTIRFADFRGKRVVLYFYPKDKTPGCTTEGEDFRDKHEAFIALDTVILGCSRDSIKSHESFREKYDFPFHLISDPDEELCKAFDVIKEKNMYGKVRLGIERSTFVIDKEGVVAHEWRKVRVKGHVEAVLEHIEGMER